MQNFGLTSEEIAAMQEVFSNFDAIEKVILYGSRARGTFKPYSDIDLTLVGSHIDFSTVTQINFALDDAVQN